MELERQRGISISSAALEFELQGRRMSLIDTPGHNDFSEDTYRALIAADSIVMVIDAANGVEPQTRKLFEVSRRHRLPILTFVNKLIGQFTGAAAMPRVCSTSSTSSSGSRAGRSNLLLKQRLIVLGRRRKRAERDDGATVLLAPTATAVRKMRSKRVRTGHLSHEPTPGCGLRVSSTE